MKLVKLFFALSLLLATHSLSALQTLVYCCGPLSCCERLVTQSYCSGLNTGFLSQSACMQYCSISWCSPD
jgi:hypothetical protein